MWGLNYKFSFTVKFELVSIHPVIYVCYFNGGFRIFRRLINGLNIIYICIKVVTHFMTSY